MRCIRLLFGLALSCCCVTAQQSDVWAPLRRFAGKWQGSYEGQPGKGTGGREYSWQLDGKFLSVSNHSKYEKELHRDYGIFSYDKREKTFVLRQFHVEGFVNEYTLTSKSDDGTKLVFETRRIENIPPGWRARESYTFIGPDELVEEFSLAEPGKDYELYSTAKLKRVRDK